MTLALKELEAAMGQLDTLLRPIAKQRVDLNDPNWFEKLKQGAPPLDRAGVRDEAEALARSIIKEYGRAEEAWRAGARGLFRRFDSFTWAAGAMANRTTSEGVRDELILFSIKDQEQDPRDAKLWLDDLCREARENGVELDGVLREVARVSNTEDRYGWGSTQQWLEEAAAQSGKVT